MYRQLTFRNGGRLGEGQWVHSQEGGYQGVPPGLLSFMGMGSESKETLQQKSVIGDEPGGLDLEERRESEDLKLAHLLGWPTCLSVDLGCWVPRECLLEWGLGCQEE